MKRILAILLCTLFCSSAISQMRKAPAYPLITHDPYFSIWTFTDKLTDEPTRHWTGSEHPMVGVVEVDGKFYRFMGQLEKAYNQIVPTADDGEYHVKYSLTQPADGWMDAGFDDDDWKTGTAPFGNRNDEVATSWDGPDLWVRRSFDIPDRDLGNLLLKLDHDDNIIVYLNGEIIYRHDGWTEEFKYHDIHDSIKKRLKKKNNVLAMHVINTAGGTYLDGGIVEEKEQQGSKMLVAEQKDLQFEATQTIYTFKAGDVDLKLTFTSPLLLDDLDLLARPVSYVSAEVKANDGENHNVRIWMGVSSTLAVHTPSQEIVAEQYNHGELNLLKAGTVEQPLLQRSGDGVRIDWGYVYVGVPKSQNSKQYLSSQESVLDGLVNSKMDVAAKKITGRSLMMNTILDYGKVSATPQEQYIMLAYDDLFSVQYFGENLRPWWNKSGSNTIEEEIKKASDNYQSVFSRSRAFDKELRQETTEVGGEKYAELCIMAYRQSIAAHKLLESPQGELLFMSKENYSNGSINTVDITYPSSPLYLIYNPDLLKGMLNGIFYYSESGKWKKPFPAHDLGTYPLANGQTYGEDMPIEEAGNMIISTAAIAKVEGNAEYAKQHWDVLTTWAEYLVQEGFDPANQLSTDDFAGHLARNANLSVKAIMGIGAYAMMADMLGEKETAARFRKSAEAMVPKWMALADDGDHYALTFDGQGTWSQKYNLVWDRVLDLNLFPQEVARKEIAYYLTKQNKYGLPLDSRRDYTKSDWVLWTAVMTDNKRDFKAFIEPMYRYAIETPSRVPISDWHDTNNAEKQNFQARSVVGGYFMKLLEKRLNQ